jgi:hypothetical protein
MPGPVAVAGDLDAQRQEPVLPPPARERFPVARSLV